MNDLPECDYFEHDADTGIIGRGKTIEKAFIAAAKSTFMIMADLKSISPKKSISIEFQESDPEFALVTWLNALVNQSRIEGIIFCKFELTHNDDHWHGKAWGDYWNEKMMRGVEVKGATLTQLKVKKIDHLWEATCVVDV